MDAGVTRTAVIGWLAGLVVVVLVTILVITAVAPSTSPSSTAGTGQSGGSPASTQNVVSTVTNISSSVLDKVGIDGHLASTTGADNPLAPFTGTSAQLPTVGGPPAMFFFGAEWCPYCAAERWSLIIALSKFGTFSGLKPAASSGSDFAPNTQTFTFSSARYTSRYLSLESVEVQDENRNPLQSPNATQTKVLNAWDPQEAFPFIDLAGRYLGTIPAWYDPASLQGLSRAKIADEAAQGGSGVGATIDANANYLIAGICAVDGGKPGSVCGSAAVRAVDTQLSHVPSATPISG